MTRWEPALQRHLDQLVRLNEKLLGLADQRRQAMISRDAARLEMLLAEERQVGLAIFEEERKRRVTMLQAAADLGRAPREAEAITLAEVAEALGEPARGRLLAQRRRLHELARRTAEANQTMQLLARRFLPYFEELLSALLEGCRGQPSYTADGQAVRQGASGMNMLDMRV
jgi:hypothetical protein